MDAARLRQVSAVAEACSYLRVGRVTTQSEPADAEAFGPELDPLPTVTELPWPPGDTVVLPVIPFEPWVVTVVELLSPVTTRQGLPLLVTTLWPLAVPTATLSAKAGVPAKSNPATTGLHTALRPIG